MFRIYIAGKVTGEDRDECEKKFAKAQKEIEKQGLVAINPLQEVGTWDIKWEQAMRICIINLMTADAVLMLEDWGGSEGARIEHRLACNLNIPTLRGIREIKERLVKQYKLKTDKIKTKNSP